MKPPKQEFKRRDRRHLLPFIIARDGGTWRCHYCGCALVPFRVPVGSPLYYRPVTVLVNGRFETEFVLRDGFQKASVDHKKPLSHGGSNHIDNLVASCDACNKAKLSTPYAEFIASLKS